MTSAKHLTIVTVKLLLIVVFGCEFSCCFGQENNADVFQVLPGENFTASPYTLPSVKDISSTPAPGWLTVKNVVVTGNKRTKDYIIMREMAIKPGDSISVPALTKKLEESRQYIYNTTLFVTVKVEPILLNAFEFDIIVTVKERWYIFPLPQFQLADRSFDEWLVKYKGNLNRVNYGMKFVHYNVSGRKDQLRLNLINGYTRNISASYSAPYSNAKLTQGFYAGAGFSQAKEIAYKINYDNSFAFFNDGGFVRSDFYITGGYTIRKAIKKREIISLSYSHIQVSDTVIANNPGYFNSNSSKKGFVDLSYTYQYTDLNNILYPLEGVSGYVSLLKRGLGIKGGINMFSIEGEYNKFYALGKKWYMSLQFAANIKLPFEQPFINQRALGDRNTFLRGLDYYTINGVAFATAKYNLKKEILNFTIPTFFKSKTYNKIPFRIFARAFTDLGYVYTKDNPNTRLSNKLLPTTGLGLDILTLYDINIRLDYSLNQLGQKRLAVNNRTGF